MRLTLILLIAVLGLDWLWHEHHALGAGRRGLPVQVTLSARNGSANTAFPEGVVDVMRVSPRGNAEPLTRFPGAAEWASRGMWFGQLRIEMTEAALGELSAIEVRLGERRFAYSAGQVASRFGRQVTAGGRIALTAPEDLRAPRSALAAFAPIMNWPGDGAMLRATFVQDHAARMLLLLLLLWADARLRRSGVEASRTLGERSARAVVLALLAYSALGVLPTIASRLLSPLPLDHLEGVQALGTWALMQGQDLYALPGVRYSGNIYTPGYYFASAAWAWLFGLSLPALRALSLVLLLGTAASAALIARQLTGRARDGLLWLPVYLLMFDYYAWVDNANKDPLHTALALLGFACFGAALREGAGRRGDVACVAAALLWACAFMTKQSHVTAVAAALGVALFVARRQFWITGVVFGVACLALTGLSLSAWGERYWLWTFDIPGGHAFSFAVLAHGLMGFLPLAAGYFVIAGRLLWPGGSGQAQCFLPGSERVRWVFVAFVLGSFVTGFMSLGKIRGGQYALMPGAAAIAVLVSIALARRRDLASALAYPLLLLAMSNPFDRWVGAHDRRAAEALIARVAAEPGEVWLPFHGFTNLAAGKPPHVALFCIGEWTASGRELPRELLSALEQRRFALVITDFNLAVGRDTAGTFGPVHAAEEPFVTLARHYRAVERIPLDQAVVQPDGWVNVPRVLWRPAP